MGIKKILSAISALTLALAAISACGGRLPEGAEAVLSRIKAPVFPAVDYPAVDYGAVADGVFDCRGAINAAITVCSDEGGGRVVLPEGKVFCKGSINLKSNVNLCVPAGCELIFSPDPLDYLPAEPTVWEGTELFN